MSILRQKSCQTVSVMKIKKNGVSRKIVCSGILIHILSWRQQKNLCLCFHYWAVLTNFWRNNWRSIFDVVERLLFKLSNVTYKRQFPSSCQCVKFDPIYGRPIPIRKKYSDFWINFYWTTLWGKLTFKVDYSFMKFIFCLNNAWRPMVLIECKQKLR